MYKALEEITQGIQNCIYSEAYGLLWGGLGDEMGTHRKAWQIALSRTCTLLLSTFPLLSTLLKTADFFFFFFVWKAGLSLPLSSLQRCEFYKEYTFRNIRTKSLGNWSLCNFFSSEWFIGPKMVLGGRNHPFILVCCWLPWKSWWHQDQAPLTGRVQRGKAPPALFAKLPAIQTTSWNGGLLRFSFSEREGEKTLPSKLITLFFPSRFVCCGVRVGRQVCVLISTWPIAPRRGSGL